MDKNSTKRNPFYVTPLDSLGYERALRAFAGIPLDVDALCRMADGMPSEQATVAKALRQAAEEIRSLRATVRIKVRLVNAGDFEDYQRACGLMGLPRTRETMPALDSPTATFVATIDVPPATSDAHREAHAVFRRLRIG